MSAFPEISVFPWQDSLGTVPAEGACGMAESYLYAASTEIPGGGGPFVPQGTLPELLLACSLTFFLSSVKMRS